MTRGAVALADYRSLVGLDLYQDDAFYYFKIARNIVDGRGMTFDGTTPTNAFHPLYLLLLLPLMVVSGSDPVTPIQLSGALLVLVSLLTGAVVFRLTRQVAGPRTALLALALWSVSPYDGKLDTKRRDRKSLGSRILFHIPIELGLEIKKHHRVSLFFDHVSNAYLADKNDGLDTLGVRYGYKF